MELPSHEELLGRIKEFLDRHDMAPTRFGREVNGEGSLIASIESGRSPSLKVLHRIADFMTEKDAELAAAPARDAA